MKLGDKIKYYREQQGLSQVELARKSGVTNAAVCQYESNMRLPNLKTYVSLLNTFKVKSEVFLRGVVLEDHNKTEEDD